MNSLADIVVISAHIVQSSQGPMRVSSCLKADGDLTRMLQALAVKHKSEDAVAAPTFEDQMQFGTENA